MIGLKMTYSDWSISSKSRSGDQKQVSFGSAIRQALCPVGRGEVWDSTRSRYVLSCYISADQRVLEFLPSHCIGQGSGQDGRAWRLEEHRGNTLPGLAGKECVTGTLARKADGVWRGRWQHYEPMPIKLVPQLPGSSGRVPVTIVRAP